MKKTMLLALALLAATVGWSQDTLYTPLQEGYYNNNIPKLDMGYMFQGVSQWGIGCGVVTKEMYTAKEDTLTVYGVAAAMVTNKESSYPLPDETEEQWLNYFYSQYLDTSLDECYEYLGLYLRSGDSLEVQQEKLVHRKFDSPTYYVESGVPRAYNPNYVYPMYERFFDTPVAVTDTFYMGVTQRSMVYPFGSPQDHMDFRLLYIGGEACNHFYEYHVNKYCWPGENVVWDWPSRGPLGYCEYYLIFPILTPRPDADTTGGSTGDSTAVGGDTLTVVPADMMVRYVSVQPNPAVDEARVLSSFGLERIEAYNAGGQKVYEGKAEGLEATLDVKGWPRGSYLLRITTPMGTVTKKLLVE